MAGDEEWDLRIPPQLLGGRDGAMAGTGTTIRSFRDGARTAVRRGEDVPRTAAGHAAGNGGTVPIAKGNLIKFRFPNFLSEFGGNSLLVL